MANPFDIAGSPGGSPEAPALADPERRARRRSLPASVFGLDTAAWVDSLLSRLDGSVPEEEQPSDTLDPR